MVLFQVTRERHVSGSMPLATDEIEIQEALRHGASLAHGTPVEADEVRVLTPKCARVDFVALEQRRDGIGKGVKILVHAPTPPQRPRRQRTDRQARHGPHGSPDWARPCRSSGSP